jgi:cytochrome c-type biogenesis protein CcmH/NrfG
MGATWDVEALDERRLAEVLATGDWKAPPTLAELMGMTGEICEAILAVAEGELQDGRVEAARTILESQVTANPKDAAAWVLLSRVHRALRQPLAARFAAEVAWRLEPASPGARLARAEGLLPFESERATARELLGSLAGEGGPEGERAGALLAAIGG